MTQQSMWIVFAAVVLGCLAVDLGLLNRKAHVVRLKEALLWSAFWVALALAFCVGVHFNLGKDRAVTFLTAYVVELSLSVDNLFVFLLIFSSFKIPPALQRRVLFWGILGALVMRAVCIGLGVVALQRFTWLTYVFGAILIWGGIKTAFSKDEDEDVNDSFVVRTLRRILPFSRELDGDRFLTRQGQGGKTMATPMLLALIVVEVSDLIFAVDSIPAVLAISQDTFVVYTSNIFAILGLRSFYFALAHLMKLFRYLEHALAVILVFIGVKIMASHHLEIPTEIALAVVLGLLAVAVLASVVIKEGGSEDGARN